MGGRGLRPRCRGALFGGFDSSARCQSRHERSGATTAMRMCRSADARGKCKYVKARPEFSYSRCPPQHSPRHPFPTPLLPASHLPSLRVASRLLDATAVPPRPLAPPPIALLSRSTACIYLRPRERHICVCDTFFENVKIARACIESDSLSSSQPPPSVASDGIFLRRFYRGKGKRASPTSIGPDRSTWHTRHTRRQRESCSPRNGRNVTLFFFFPLFDIQESLRFSRTRFFSLSRENQHIHFHSHQRAITCHISVLYHHSC